MSNQPTTPSPGGQVVVVYDTPDGAVHVNVRLDQENVWLTQRQMAAVFQTSIDNVGLHLKKHFLLRGNWVRGNYRGFLSRSIRRAAPSAPLSQALQPGCRHLGWLPGQCKARRGFPPVATRTLREHLVRGFTLNERRLAERGLAEARATVNLLAQTLKNQALVDDTGQAVLNLIAHYAHTWRLLLEYDEDRLQPPSSTKPATSALALDRGHRCD